MQAGANRQMMFRAVSRAFASGSTQRMRLLERTAIRGRGWKLLLLEPWYIIQQGALTLCPPGRDRKQRTRMADQTTPSSPAKIDLAAIVASAKRALPGQTPASLREYSFSYDPVSKKILLKAETERTPTEQELDDLQVAESEIHADFWDAAEVKTVIEIVPPGAALNPLPEGVIFRREDRRG